MANVANVSSCWRCSGIRIQRRFRAGRWTPRVRSDQRQMESRCQRVGAHPGRFRVIECPLGYSHVLPLSIGACEVPLGVAAADRHCQEQQHCLDTERALDECGVSNTCSSASTRQFTRKP
jgi:hypothetical protein